ncbi:MAG: methyltransferase domain-containing protein [Alphaproteobacteria bacterium]|nr:methyltransferase domain-containing protein [Alphaproteobacteria bacterium]
MQGKLSAPVSRRFFVAGAGALLATPFVHRYAVAQPALDVPYVPTPQDVVDRMLELVKLTQQDFVMDLGCGDGRMLVTAARKFGSRGFGVDLNPARIAEATKNAQAANVTDKIRFEVRNLFQTSIKDANVLTMYLLPSVNLQLRPRILDEMAPGSRIVSHAFHMGDWEPDVQTEAIGRTIYHWIVPAKMAGKWSLSDGGETYDVMIEQKYQRLTGQATVDGMILRLQGFMRGGTFSIAVNTPDGVKTYTGSIADVAVTPAAGAGWSMRKA